MNDNDELIKLLKSQHSEQMEKSSETVRLLGLYTAEQRLAFVRVEMLDETLKKVLIAITDFGGTAKSLLREFNK